MRGASQSKTRATALAEGLLGACNCAISDLQADGVTEPVIRILRGLLEVDTRLH